MFTVFLLLCALLNFHQCNNNVEARSTSTDRKHAKTILSHMDKTADPCEDFYQYACGNWGEVHISQAYDETITLIDYNVNHEYAQSFKILKRGSNQQQFVQKTLDFYESCVNVEEYEPKEYLKWLTQHEQINWSAKDFDWLLTLAKLRKYGFNGVFLEEIVAQRRQNGSASIIDVDKPVLANGFEPMKRESYELMTDYLAERKTRRQQQLWNEFHAFEVVLLALTELEDEIGHQVLTLQQLNMTWIERYLSVVLDEHILSQFEISVQNLPYLVAINNFLQKTDAEFLSHYLKIRFLWYLHLDGPTNFIDTDCIYHVRAILPQAMSWLYEKQHPELREEAKYIEALFQHLIAHFHSALNKNAHNFNATILQFLHGKLESMHIKVGNLPRSSTTLRLEQFYRNLHINSSDFYGNHLRLLNFYKNVTHQQLQTLQIPGDDFFNLEDPETGASSSPYFLLRFNTVIVPLTLLHSTFYNRHMNDLYKHSALGFLLAHEISHGFDDSGVEFDEQGNMVSIADGIKANEIFDNSMSCLRSKNPDIIDERIADVSGVRLAYEAYFKNATSATSYAQQQERLTGLTPKRLFFVNFAQFFCGRKNDKSNRDTSNHGSDRDRVFYALSSFEEFSQVYNCPANSKMNPAKKCRLWR